LNAAIGIHFVDFKVPVAATNENYLGAVRRPLRLIVIRQTGGQPRLVRAVKVHRKNIVIAIVARTPKHDLGYHVDSLWTALREDVNACQRYAGAGNYEKRQDPQDMKVVLKRENHLGSPFPEDWMGSKNEPGDVKVPVESEK
jgi:hypothetical protein